MGVMSKKVLFAVMVALMGCAAWAARPQWTCYLNVSPLMGETETNKGGSSLRMNSFNSGSSSTKTIKRNMRWRADVRVMGKGRPKEAELRVFYIAYQGEDGMKPYIIKKEKKALKLAEEGKDSVELTSPTTRLTKSRTRSSSGSSHSGFRSTKTTTRGERIGGCVMQLVVEGKVNRVWVSNPAWEKVAWEDPFTEETLKKKPHNSLN